MKRGRFVIDPVVLVETVLPPGNRIVGVATLSNGKMVFEFEGIDVPLEAQIKPLLHLMGHRAALVHRDVFWFEPVERDALSADRNPGRTRPVRTTPIRGRHAK